jgi:hypothetical protein
MAHDGHPHHHHRIPVAAWGTTIARPPMADAPHRPPAPHGPDQAEPDLDLVETAFLDAFPQCPDPTSFLRLAGVPFTGKGKDGVILSLLRVEANQATRRCSPSSAA